MSGINRSRFVSIVRRGLIAAAVLALTWPRTAPAQEAGGPIMVLLDLHADPLFGPPPVQIQTYHDWVIAMDWLLDVAEVREAKISFLSGGDFMEWVLEDTVGGYPLIQRLYASGGQVGTHSHDQMRFGPHDWRSIGFNPPPDQVLQLWNDHVGMVNAVITAALGVSDPQQIQAINCSRGSHVPADDAERIQMMADFGFTNHQQGPDEQFYAYFKHYPMNPFRPSGTRFLEHDPNGPVVVAPFGPVLGLNEVHFGINQDMRMPAVQGRFLLEILNWLHDVHIAGTGRVWVTGWGAHSADVLPGTPTRSVYPPMLDWLVQQFINKPVGGQVAAVFAGVPEARDAYYAWETAHPGEVSFSYPADATDWNLYPYLIPAVTYLTEAWYETVMTPVGTVRWHRLTASTAAGGPYNLYVAYTTDGVPVTADLSGSLGAGQIAAISPFTGAARILPTDAMEVRTLGTILVPTNKIVLFPGTGDFDEDGDVDLGDYAAFQVCFGGEGPLGGECAPGDFDADGALDLFDYSGFEANFTGAR